ncbi:MAG: 6,7-dimethyl-8-ribityllumazine synthase [Candidatus Azotimanducaceae bacterium]|jgi:6,7-dimethyl-8-ribityllumazine synthase
MYHIAFVQSCWHKEIVDQFKRGFAEAIEPLVGTSVQLEFFEAPGVVEIPLLTKLLANQGQYDAIAVSGLIVDHGVYHHEFVAQSVMDSIMAIQMETEVPVIYGILTAQDFMSEGRAEFFFDHFLIKGAEAARACAMTLQNMEQIKGVGTLVAQKTKSQKSVGM